MCYYASMCARMRPFVCALSPVRLSHDAACLRARNRVRACVCVCVCVPTRAYKRRMRVGQKYYF